MKCNRTPSINSQQTDIVWPNIPPNFPTVQPQWNSWKYHYIIMDSWYRLSEWFFRSNVRGPAELKSHLTRRYLHGRNTNVIVLTIKENTTNHCDIVVHCPSFVSMPSSFIEHSNIDGVSMATPLTIILVNARGPQSIGCHPCANRNWI